MSVTGADVIAAMQKRKSYGGKGILGVMNVGDTDTMILSAAKPPFTEMVPLDQVDPEKLNAPRNWNL